MNFVHSGRSRTITHTVHVPLSLFRYECPRTGAPVPISTIRACATGESVQVRFGANTSLYRSAPFHRVVVGPRARAYRPWEFSLLLRIRSYRCRSRRLRLKRLRRFTRTVAVKATAGDLLRETGRQHVVRLLVSPGIRTKNKVCGTRRNADDRKTARVPCPTPPPDARGHDESVRRRKTSTKRSVFETFRSLRDAYSCESVSFRTTRTGECRPRQSRRVFTTTKRRRPRKPTSARPNVKAIVASARTVVVSPSATVRATRMAARPRPGPVGRRGDGRRREDAAGGPRDVTRRLRDAFGRRGDVSRAAGARCD